MKTILLHEWRQLRADRMALACLGLFLALLLYALASGTFQQQRQQQTLAATAQEETERLAKLKAQLLRIESGKASAAGFLDPRSGTAIGNTSGVRYITMPPAPLGTLSVGLGDLHPYFYKLSLRSKSFTLNNEELENPLNLLSGPFDLAFGIVILFPLFLIALNYNLLSAEREQGTLALILSQPISLKALVTGKVLVRGGALVVAAVAVTLAGGLLFGAGAAVFPRLLAWTAIILLYGLFWMGLCVWVNAWGRSSATNAIALSAFWLGFCLIIPSALNIAASALYPIPSRVEMIQSLRTAGKEAQEQGSRLLSRYLEDHPEFAPAPAPGAPPAPAPDFGSITYAVQMEVDKRTEPVLARFEQAIAQQQAFVDRLRYLSPAVLAQGALNEFSGTGLARYRGFQLQAERFHRTWQQYFFPKIFQKAKLTSGEIDTLPRFRYQEESLEAVVARSAPLLAVLTLLSLLAGGLSLASLRKFKRSL
ncbi:MAG: DUF3526 domain-containing protein [Bryobacteraceae bacterium]|nr:DUF3526 domain-containing protein [Bryobacteraceae bacterium]